nr:putative late blight resistance protein homolog R1B-16 isoform X1 [Ipomoea batatas]
MSGLKDWRNAHFTILECLILSCCWDLEEFPASFADITCLRLIMLTSCRPSLLNSAKQIQEERLGYRDDKFIVKDDFCTLFQRKEENQITIKKREEQATEVDVDDHSTAPARKTSQQTHPNPKGKSSNSLNQPRQSAAPRTENARRADAGNSINPNSYVRGRGRFNGSSRGKEKATNNRDIAPQREHLVINGGTGNADNVGNVGYFQFGSQALAPNIQTAGAQYTFNVGSTSRFTPGEGGGQTSLPDNPSP